METELPTEPDKGRRFVSRRLLVIAALILLGLGYYFYKRAPNFNGSEVSSIEIRMFGPRMPIGLEVNEDSSRSHEPELLLEASLTDPSACAAVFNFLKSARRRQNHKCGSIGTFEIQYADGKMDVLSILPGHDPAGYEFRFDEGLYQLPREEFFQTLRDAGVDSSKMPESEH